MMIALNVAIGGLLLAIHSTRGGAHRFVRALKSKRGIVKFAEPAIASAWFLVSKGYPLGLEGADVLSKKVIGAPSPDLPGQQIRRTETLVTRFQEPLP